MSTSQRPAAGSPDRHDRRRSAPAGRARTTAPGSSRPDTTTGRPQTGTKDAAGAPPDAATTAEPGPRMVTALVLGVVSVPAAFFFPAAGVLGAVALWLGIIELRRMKRGKPGNRRVAVWAVITGATGVFIGLAIVDLVGQLLNGSLNP